MFKIANDFPQPPGVSATIFAIPIFDQVIIYAPLRNFAALVDQTVALYLQDSIISGRPARKDRLNEILHILNEEPSIPLPKQGNFLPAFLGLLPTRGCNLACRYCGFGAADQPDKVMDLKLAANAINWYMGLVSRANLPGAEVHFFGGEPFCAEEIIDLSVNLARIKAGDFGCTPRFEVATNAIFSEKRCRWVADNFDTVVLSLDGPATIHNNHRPYKNGQGSFETVSRNAAILAEGPVDLFLRACVTTQTVKRMPEIAAYFCDAFHPMGVSFEPFKPAKQIPPGPDDFEPPDPWEFARNFIQAAWILEAHGVEPVYAAGDIRTRRVTFCPVGRDVAIISPDGVVNNCYLLESEWQAQGLNLRLGRLDADRKITLDPKAVTYTRSLNVWNKPFCHRCFCQWHCAGGCHVTHSLPPAPGDYDRLCLQTRIITLRNILKAMEKENLVRRLLDQPDALAQTIRQASDKLVELDFR